MRAVAAGAVKQNRGVMRRGSRSSASWHLPDRNTMPRVKPACNYRTRAIAAIRHAAEGVAPRGRDKSLSGLPWLLQVCGWRLHVDAAYTLKLQTARVGPKLSNTLGCFTHGIKISFSNWLVIIWRFTTRVESWYHQGSPASTSRSSCYPNTFPSCAASQSHIPVGRGWNPPVPSDTEWRAYVSPSIFFLSPLPYVSSSLLSFSRLPLFLSPHFPLLPPSLFPTFLPPFPLFYFHHFFYYSHFLPLLHLLHPPPFTSTASFFFSFLSSLLPLPLFILLLFYLLYLPLPLYPALTATLATYFHQLNCLMGIPEAFPFTVVFTCTHKSDLEDQSVPSGFVCTYTCTLMWSSTLQIAVQSVQMQMKTVANKGSGTVHRLVTLLLHQFNP